MYTPEVQWDGLGGKAELFSSHNYQALYGAGANWRLFGVSRSVARAIVILLCFTIQTWTP